MSNNANGAKVCAHEDARIPYQCYADDAALYTEVSYANDYGESANRLTLRTELEDKSERPLKALKARALNRGLLPSGKRSARDHLDHLHR